MKALTMYQPHASLQAQGHRIFETRSWGTEYRGPLALHAGRKVDPELRPAAVEMAKQLLDVGDLEDLPTSAVLATAKLVNCHLITPEFVGLLSEQERTFGDFSEGRFAWELQDVVELPAPVPHQGKLKLWEWDEDAESGEFDPEEDADMVDEGVPLTLEGELFADLRDQFNDMLASTLADMEKKSAYEADLTCKLKISLEKYSDGVLPEFEYKITSTIPTKESCSGKIDKDTRLVYDQEEQQYVVITINHGQTTLFKPDQQKITTTVDPTGVVTNVEFGGAVDEEDGKLGDFTIEAGPGLRTELKAAQDAPADPPEDEAETTTEATT